MYSGLMPETTTATETRPCYAVLVAAGRPAEYGPKVGWDHLHTTREEAEATAARARRQDGWEARVITMDASEAARLGWLSL